MHSNGATAQIRWESSMQVSGGAIPTGDDRSFVRLTDCARREDGGPGPSASGDRDAEPAISRPVPDDEGDRGEHPHRRTGRHDGRGAGTARDCRASPHSALRSDADQTARMVAAVSAPGVHILGHPRGRKFGSRPGVAAGWPRLRGGQPPAASRSKSMAIRRDRTWTSSSHAKLVEHGCLFALDSDAHSTGELQFAETAVAHARLAQIPPDRIINTWPLEQLLAWADGR